MREDRDKRQARVARWCREAFGEGQAGSPEQRGVRLLEEALELYQAVGGSPVMAHQLVEYVYDRPPGGVGQEMGGVGVTLLALGEAVGMSADTEEAREVARVLSKPLSHFAARNAAKNAAGFDTGAADERQD